MFKRDLKINFYILEEKISEIKKYITALDKMEKSAANMIKILRENESKAISGLQKQYNKLKKDIKSCHSELKDLEKILSGYTNEMQSIIKPNNKNAIMRVDRNDIYFNMKSIVSACKKIDSSYLTVYCGNVGILNQLGIGKSEKEKANEEQNYKKIENILNNVVPKYKNKMSKHIQALEDIHKRKIIPFENKDDEYNKKVNKLKGKYTSFWESVLISIGGEQGIKVWNKIKEAFLKGMEQNNCQFSIDPVNLSTGNFVYDKKDLIIGGTKPLIFKRIYNSTDKSVGCFGKKWTHNMLTKLTVNNKLSSITISYEDSHEEEFFKDELGIYKSMMNNKNILYFIEDIFILKTCNYNIYKFQRTGECIEKIDSKGNSIKFTNKDGKLIGISNICGDFYLNYQEKGFISEIEDMTGRKQKYTYDNDILINVVDEKGIMISYEYDENFNIIAINNEESICQVKNKFDNKGRTVSQIFPDGGTMQYEYKDDENSVDLIQQNGNRITYIHDENFRNIKTIYTDGEEIIKFDENGYKNLYKDKKGNETKYEYNKNGDLKKSIDPLGQILEIKYDSKRKPICICRQDGSKVNNFYNNKGYLIKSIDPLGRSISYRFGVSSRPKEVILSDNSKYKFTYDKRENITSITDTMGNTAYYEYDNLNRVCKTIDAKSNITSFKFDRNNRITKVTNAKGDSRYYSYNKIGSVTKFIDFDGSNYDMYYNKLDKLNKFVDPLGKITSYQYDLMWNMSCITNANREKTKYLYNSLNHLSEVLTEDGAKTSYQYDSKGNVIAIVYPNNEMIKFEYDALNRNTIIIDEKNNKTYKEYDSMGHVKRIYDDKNQKIEFLYDIAGQLIKKVDKLGNCVKMTYNVLGKIESFTDINGNIVNYEYFPGGKLKKVNDPNGNTIDYKYDENGNIKSKTKNNNLVIFYYYDELNRLIEIKDSQNISKKFEYDAVNNVIASIDEKGNKTAYNYQPMNRLIKVKDALGSETQYDYDNVGRLVGVSQTIGEQDLYHEAQKLNSQKLLYERDSMGRIIKVTDALGNIEHFKHDLMGNIVSHTDKNSNKKEYKYNEFNKINHIAYSDGKSVELIYNELKQLIQIKDWLGNTNIDIDSNGFLRAVTDQNNKTVKYKYNQLGQRTSIKYPNGKEVNYSYNKLNQIVEINTEGIEVDYKYNKQMKLIEKNFNNGVKTSYNYNDLGQLKELINYDIDGVLDQFKYEYELTGNKKKIDKFRRDIKEDSGIFEYEYDALGRLTETFKDNNLLRKYNYDAMGNRIQLKENNNLINYSYDEAGQLIFSKGENILKKYMYDKCGNLESVFNNNEISDTYKYDVAGNMRFFNGKEYTYNSMGNKVNDSNNNYILDLTKNYKNVLIKNEKSFIWDMSILGDDNNLYLQDELGSPIRAIDNNGKVCDNNYYNEFGNKEKIGTGDFAFTGYEEDNEMYFAQARYYKPEIGRFITRDKIKGHIIYPKTTNEYVYVYNNPLNYVDMDGNIPTFGDMKNGIWDVANCVGDTFDNAKNSVVNTVSTGSDYVTDTATKGFNILDDNILNPVSEFSEHPILNTIGAASKVECYFSNNTFDEVLGNLNSLTNGMFKETVYKITIATAKLHIPERIKDVYNELLPPPMQFVIENQFKTNLYTFNWTMDKIAPSSVEGYLTNDLLKPVTGYMLGFNYDPEKDIYYTTEGSLQQQFGFGEAFDEIGPLLGMDLEEQAVVFEYNDREYLLEPWMGKYGSGISTGGEIGIYSRSIDDKFDGQFDKNGDNTHIFYQSASEDEQLKMTHELVDSSTGEVVLDVDTSDYEGKDYWALGIKSFDNTKKEDLVMNATIEHEDKEYLAVMQKALVEEGVDANIKNGVLNFTWDPNNNLKSGKK